MRRVFSLHQHVRPYLLSAVSASSQPQQHPGVSVTHPGSFDDEGMVVNAGYAMRDNHAQVCTASLLALIKHRQHHRIFL